MNRKGTYNVVHKHNINLFGIKIWIKRNLNNSISTCSKCDLSRVCESNKLYILCFHSILKGYYFKLPKNILIYKHQKYRIYRLPIHDKSQACMKCDIGSFSKCNFGNKICSLFKGNVYLKKIDNE